MHELGTLKKSARSACKKTGGATSGLWTIPFEDHWAQRLALSHTPCLSVYRNGGRQSATGSIMALCMMVLDEIDLKIETAELDDVGAALKQGGQTAKIDERQGFPGKRKLAAQPLRKMMVLDPERAMALAKSWAQGVQHPARRVEEKDWKSLDEYIPFRLPEDEEEERRTLLKPAVIACLMTNDLFSYEKEKFDNSPQNAVAVIMKINECNEDEAKELCKQRIRVECTKYARIVVLQPYRYLTSLPSKGFRDQAIDSLNAWLRVPPSSVAVIKDVIKMLHSASLMLDDIEDSSPWRT
ncbi:hypothetical protein BDW69DRAFT_190036 [Aspergillus filifer]